MGRSLDRWLGKAILGGELEHWPGVAKELTEP